MLYYKQEYNVNVGCVFVYECLYNLAFYKNPKLLSQKEPRLALTMAYVL